MPLEQTFSAVDKNLHDLKGFDCGKPTMNEFLARHAVKHSKLGLSRTYVLPNAAEDSKQAIAAYYTLAASTVARFDISAKHSLPSYPVPVVILARLGVSRQYQGRGLGAKSLVHSLRQAINLTRAGLPAYGLVLDVLDDQALAFYENFHLFKPFTNNPLRLFVPMSTLEQV